MKVRRENITLIELYRIKNGLRQSDLAIKSGLHIKTISNIERSGELSLRSLNALNKVLKFNARDYKKLVKLAK
jgi:transcriptional regulator with XRE-family HTH domain